MYYLRKLNIINDPNEISKPVQVIIFSIIGILVLCSIVYFIYKIYCNN